MTRHFLVDTDLTQAEQTEVLELNHGDTVHVR